MGLALEEAQKAFQQEEVPVGAVIAKGDKLLSRAYNLREKARDPLGHAELLAIKSASQKLRSWRLEGYSLYVSLEPCLMCMGAIMQSRLSRLFYACPDPKAGFSSYYGLDKQKGFPRKLKISSGLRARESSPLLKKFFKGLRG